MNATRKQYIDAIKDEMISTCQGTNLFPSVMIAQGCLESADGNSELSHIHHNHFGIKATPNWKGDVINMLTKEYERGQPKMLKQPFRSYPNSSACFEDHIAMLKRVPAYKLAGLFDCTTPEGQCIALRKAGYATDPSYPQKLIKIIQENYLKEYDPQPVV